MIIITKKDNPTPDMSLDRWIVTKVLNGTEKQRTEMISHEQAEDYASRFTLIYGDVLDLTNPRL